MNGKSLQSQSSSVLSMMKLLLVKFCGLPFSEPAFMAWMKRDRASRKCFTISLSWWFAWICRESVGSRHCGQYALLLFLSWNWMLLRMHWEQTAGTIHHKVAPSFNFFIMWQWSHLRAETQASLVAGYEWASQDRPFVQADTVWTLFVPKIFPASWRRTNFDVSEAWPWLNGWVNGSYNYGHTAGLKVYWNSLDRCCNALPPRAPRTLRPPQAIPHLHALPPCNLYVSSFYVRNFLWRTHLLEFCPRKVSKQRLTLRNLHLAI